MSIHPTHDPACAASLIEGRPRDLGGFTVQRVLPAIGHRMVGPFIFFDHMRGRGIDVRPHPHIGLATVTYLFDGEIVHRDSLGSHQTIRPGEINWMTAGRGIVHSERTAPERRDAAVHGIQLWVALPTEDEETAPAFHHHPASSLPAIDLDGTRLIVLAGTAYGVTSPVRVSSPLCYVDAAIPANGELRVPPEHAERAVYVVDGALACDAVPLIGGQMLVLAPDAEVTLRATAATRVVLIGGAPVGPRHIFWNFVSSSKDRIEQAKRDWQEERFPKVPGDELERVPLP